MLNQYQLEQRYRVTAGPSIVLAVQIFYQIVDAREIHRCVDFPQQMVWGDQHVHTQHLDCLPLFGFSLQHLHHLLPLYQNRPLHATFLTDCGPNPFGLGPCAHSLFAMLQ